MTGPVTALVGKLQNVSGQLMTVTEQIEDKYPLDVDEHYAFRVYPGKPDLDNTMAWLNSAIWDLVRLIYTINNADKDASELMNISREVLGRIKVLPMHDSEDEDTALAQETARYAMQRVTSLRTLVEV